MYHCGKRNLFFSFFSPRHDPSFSARPWWFKWGCFRSGHSPPSASSRGGPLAHDSALSVPHPTPVRHAAAPPWWTRRRQRRKPAQRWVTNIQHWIKNRSVRIGGIENKCHIKTVTPYRLKTCLFFKVCILLLLIKQHQPWGRNHVSFMLETFIKMSVGTACKFLFPIIQSMFCKHYVVQLGFKDILVLELLKFNITIFIESLFKSTEA